MTRERAVLLLADVDQERAQQILQRILEDFREHFPSAAPLAVAIGYFEISETSTDAAAKDVLPRVFATPPSSH
jgi:GGDEF domain-containing protein